MAAERRVVHFEGTVQGVGFRYTTVRIAGYHEVAGTVRNLPDGRVEVLAEGEPEALDAFLDEVRDRMGRYIRRATQQTAEATGQYQGFNVSF